MWNKEELLSRTNNGLNVFKHYIPGQWRIGRNFLNPLYNDTKPSCNVFFDRYNGCYRIKDFGNNEFSGDCFFFVGKMKGLDCSNPKDFVEIMKIINRDMSLGLDECFPIVHAIENEQVVGNSMIGITEKRPFKVVQKHFSADEIAFWQSYGINSDMLSSYKVVSLKEFKSENNEGTHFSFIASIQEPIFGYKGKNHVKIYRPFSKIRFLYGGDFGENYCFGLEQLPPKGDTLFITGGEKDVLSLASRGFHAICFNSETTAIPSGIIRKLSYRFKHIILLYDSDKTGLEASQKHLQLLAEFGVQRLVLPLSGAKQEKDISDYFKLGNSREDFQKLFLEFLENIYYETMAILKPCEIDFGNPPQKAEMIVSINDVPLGTQGNLFGITGGEGTGKSNFVGSLIAGAIRNVGSDVDTLGVSVYPNEECKAVLHYDTEQSEVQLYKNVSNVLRRAKVKTMPGYLKAFCLTSMSRKERLQAIIQSMDKFYYQFGGIHLVVIDGIADLIRCANDEAESTGIIDELYRLAGIYKTCIVCVLHFIPNGLKLRGHLGSELQRKAAGILSIEKDDNPDISVVKALKVRDGSPLDVPLIQFAWDKKMGMHTYKGEKPKQEKEKRKEKELTGVAREIFEEQAFLTYIELCDKIQQVMEVKERTAKSYIRFMREKEIILTDPSNLNYYIIGHL